MLNKIIEFSLNNRLLVAVISALILVLGIYSVSKMEVDVFPDLNAPTVVVLTEAPGMAPEEVERLVTYPIETSVNGATGVRRVRSSSTTGFSVVWVEFDWDTEIYHARQIVSEKIATVMDALPQYVGTPTLGPQSSILGEVLFVALTIDKNVNDDENPAMSESSLSQGEGGWRGSSTSLQDLRTLADWAIRPRLLATGGVAQVAVLGGEVKEYQILLSPEKMMHYGVSLSEVMEVVSGMNQNATGGTLYEYGNEYIIRGMLSTNNVDDIAHTVVKRVGESPLLLHHIAEVKVGDQRPKFGVASLRTEPAVILTVTKQPHTSTLELTEKLDATLEEVKAACKAVCADEFIESFPDGYNTVVNERGGMLSQGQKQLIAFARTMLRNPAVLILDEATSSIDANTEKLLQIGIESLLKGRTSFIIAHRLSTIKNCDKIMFIQDGRIVETGSHDELMAKKGAYYKLCMAQDT